jgi:hypothetical protein
MEEKFINDVPISDTIICFNKSNEKFEIHIGTKKYILRKLENYDRPQEDFDYAQIKKMWKSLSKESCIFFIKEIEEILQNLKLTLKEKESKNIKIPSNNKIKFIGNKMAFEINSNDKY